MLVKSLGAVVTTECEFKLPGCTATAPSPVVVVKEVFSGMQHNLCRSCLETLIREGDWEMNKTSVSFRSDLAIVPENSIMPVVALELKSRSWVGSRDERERAIKWYMNQLHHASSIPSKYLMLMIPRGHLWVFDTALAREKAIYTEVQSVSSQEVLEDLGIKIDETLEEPFLSIELEGLFGRMLELSLLEEKPEWFARLHLPEVLGERYRIVRNFSAVA